MRIKTVLPDNLIKWIDTESTSKNERDRLARLSRYVFGKYLYNQISFDDYIEISAKHFRNQVGTHYLRDLDRLKFAGIIQVEKDKTGKELYHYFLDNRLGRCKRYAINEKYIYSDPKITSYNTKFKKQFDKDFITRTTVSLLSRLQLTIDARNLERYVKNLVTTEYIRERLKINQEIPQDYYQLPKAKYPRDRNHLLEIAKRSNLDLILYRDKCHMAPAEQFIDKRVTSTRAAYLDQLTKIKNIRQRQNIYCSRNDTNARLDTNLTNIKSDLIKHLRLDGERLGSIDLKNSQFTLLSYVIGYSMDYIQNLDRKYMKNDNIYETMSGRSRYLKAYKERETIYKVINKYIETLTTINVTHFTTESIEKNDLTISLPSDLIEFQKSTKSGVFYDQFAKVLGTTLNVEIDRDYAKKRMFMIAFSNYRYSPTAKKILKQYYPSLVLFMDTFKKLAGSNQLAIMLQEIESAIFVDTILAELLKNGYRVFTKHDSILCKESDLNAVSALVRDHLDSILGSGNYRLKIES